MKLFSQEFLTAVVDTMLPGLPATASHTALPAASQIGLDRQLADHLRQHPQRDRLVGRLSMLAELASGEQNFSNTDMATRIQFIQKLETLDTPAFYAFLLVVTADYYETKSVIRAMGWPVEPPQPQGYPLPAFDEALLAPVKTRVALWRE